MDLHTSLEQTITSHFYIDLMTIVAKLPHIEDSTLFISYSIATATVYAEMLSTNITNLKTVSLSLHC